VVANVASCAVANPMSRADRGSGTGARVPTYWSVDNAARAGFAPLLRESPRVVRAADR
jgi:hypothetical protein